jgi:hypothetical protein
MFLRIKNMYVAIQEVIKLLSLIEKQRDIYKEGGIIYSCIAQEKEKLD